MLERIEDGGFAPNVGEGYHLRFVVPKVESKCDECSHDLERRPDDHREVILRRLKVMNSTQHP